MSNNKSDDNKVRPLKSTAIETQEPESSDTLETGESQRAPLPERQMRICKGIIGEDALLTFRGQVEIIRAKPVKWKTLVDNKLVKVRGYKVWYTPIFNVSEEAETGTDVNSELHS